jgi:hypothetical protein
MGGIVRVGSDLIGWVTIVSYGSRSKLSEEQVLVSQYHVATERYTAAVGELSQQRATADKDGYQKLLIIVEDARNECERVRNALTQLHDSKG